MIRDGSLVEAARSQLFIAESYYWIHAGGAPGGDDGAGERDGGQECGYGAEGGGVGGAYAEEQAGHHASQESGSGETGNDADGG